MTPVYRITTAVPAWFLRLGWKEVNIVRIASNVTYYISPSRLLRSPTSPGGVAKSTSSDFIRGRSTPTLFLTAMVPYGELLVKHYWQASSCWRTWRSAWAAEMRSRRALRGPNPFLAFTTTSGRMVGAPRTVSLWSRSEASRCQENVYGIMKSTRTFRRHSRPIFLSCLTDTIS